MGVGGGASPLPQHRRPIKHYIPAHYDLRSNINPRLCHPSKASLIKVPNFGASLNSFLI